MGKKLEMVIGINPISSKDKIFGKLNDQHQELLKKLVLNLMFLKSWLWGMLVLNNTLHCFSVKQAPKVPLICPQ